MTSAEDLHIEVSTSGGPDGSGIGSIGYQGEREVLLTAADGTPCHAKVTRTQLTRLRRDANKVDPSEWPAADELEDAPTGPVVYALTIVRGADRHSIRWAAGAERDVRPDALGLFNTMWKLRKDLLRVCVKRGRLPRDAR